MEFTKLTIDWNAEPNAPEEKITVIGDTVVVEFYLNSFVYEEFSEDDKGRLTFIGCHKYSTNGSNDEGYYMGQHRYKYQYLPWGEFYQLETDWRLDFADEPIFLSEPDSKTQLNHYLFFFKDSTFECVAAGYKIDFLHSH